MNPAEVTTTMNDPELIELPVHLRLRKYIKSKGYVIRILAERSGIGEKKLYKILNGKCRLTADDLEKICTGGLPVEPAYFFENKFSEMEN